MLRSKIVEKSSKLIFLLAAVVSIVAVFAIFLFLLIKGLPAFQKIGFFSFLFGSTWNSFSYDTFLAPLVGEYGILTMIVGSIFSTAGALLVGGVLGYYTAIYLAKFCPKKLKKPLTALVNLLAGIPSVVYGFFGIKVLLPMLGIFSPNGDGSGMLSVSLVLGIMILPTIVTLSKTSIEAVPSSYYEGARALGASKEQAVFLTVVPAAKSGIVASFVLGIGRAVGETMAVVMVSGNSVTFPSGLFGSFRTLTANVVLEMGYAGELQMSALIATGVILLLFVIVINLLFSLATNRKTKNKEPNSIVLFAPLLSVVKKYKDVLSTYFFLIYVKFLAATKLKARKLSRYLSTIATVIAVLFLIVIIGFVLINGIPHLNWQFLTSDYVYGETVSIFPSIVATLMLVLLSVGLAIPMGIMTAIYLQEYAKRGSRAVKIIRSAVEILSGIPSIVYGLFGMIFFCDILGLGTSILAGSLTVCIMILPTVVRSTEESLKAVPDSYREGSLALGAGKLRTIFRVVLPSALPGIMSAVILSMGRVVSESAPLMFTMGASLKPLPTNGFLCGGTSLAVALYKLSGEGHHIDEAYATACVLILIVLTLNMLAGLISKKIERRLGK